MCLEVKLQKTDSFLQNCLEVEMQEVRYVPVD